MIAPATATALPAQELLADMPDIFQENARNRMTSLLQHRQARYADEHRGLEISMLRQELRDLRSYSERENLGSDAKGKAASGQNLSVKIPD